MHITAILMSGGVGARMGATTPKQYLPLLGKPVAIHSFKLLKECPHIDEIVVVCDPRFQHLFPGVRFAPQGDIRQESLFNGLQKVSRETDFVLTHDAARPLVNENDLERLIQVGISSGAATLATLVKTTIKETNDDLIVRKTLDRSNLYDIQTPQILRLDLLKQGFEKIKQEKITVTDDVSIAELLDYPVKLVIGSNENIKITTPEDLALAEIFFHERV